MGQNINQFIVEGNLTKDVVLGRTPRGTPKATYTLACDREFMVGNERQQVTDFLPVRTYGKQAENDAKYLRSGSLVTVTGHLASWFNRERGQGGVFLEADRVIYRGKPARAPENIRNAPAEDEWLNEYNHAEQALGDGA